MKNSAYLLFLTVTLSCCKTNSSLNYSISNLTITDTINCQGALLYDDKQKVIKFYFLKKEPSIQELKKLILKKESYYFIEPHKFRRYNRSVSICVDSIKQRNYTNKMVNVSENFKALYIEHDNFIVLKDSLQKEYLTLECW